MLPLQGEEEGSQRKVLVHVLLVVSPVIHMLSVLIVFQKEIKRKSFAKGKFGKSHKGKGKPY